jgi:branched-chain amino acid aminotransferase
MGLTIYVNGEYMDRDAPCISIFDHGLLYGDGIFEGIRAYNKRIFKFDEHMDRLYNSARAIDMEIPLEKEEFKRIIIDLCRRNEIVNGYMRPIVTRGKGDLGLDPRRCKKATVAVIAQPFDPLYGDAYEKGLKVITTSWRRNPPQCVNPNIKSLNYLNNVLARIDANQSNADEALFLDNEGYVSEASADNFFIVLDEVVTSPPSVTNLRGITRDTAMELSEQKGWKTRKRKFTLFDVYSAEECFITGTAAEIGPVVDVDGRVIADGKPGPKTLELMKAYKDLVNSTGTPIYE